MEKTVGKKSGQKEKSLNFEDIAKEVVLFSRKVNTLSKSMDFAIEEVMPKIFKDNIEEVYQNAKKSLDFFMRHII